MFLDRDQENLFDMVWDALYLKAGAQMLCTLRLKGSMLIKTTFVV
jgi:hypothetical protein